MGGANKLWVACRSASIAVGTPKPDRHATVPVPYMSDIRRGKRLPPREDTDRVLPSFASA